MSQKEKKKLVSIKTDDTLMETALHGINLFPYKLYDENITDYDFNCIDWHWHTEFEFVYIESGIVHFNVGEDKCMHRLNLVYVMKKNVFLSF